MLFRSERNTAEEDIKECLADLFKLYQKRYPIDEGGEEVTTNVGQGSAGKIQHEKTLTAYD